MGTILKRKLTYLHIFKRERVHAFVDDWMCLLFGVGVVTSNQHNVRPTKKPPSPTTRTTTTILIQF